ncbi:class I adenylate-forming enzyme family protein [Skermania piniformis]|uniref:AMP-binding protein n=1 Tax=Skermania pinensis TaxID=39122 RepID=A0ABX8S559_9ACTN|nr:AMP-binding protein [Skermania piniformis]QXQ12959.1 AMP-binding protein [Skermania piniformis]
MIPHPLTRRLGEVLTLAPDSPAIEFDGRWHTWGELAGPAARIAVATRAHVENGRADVGILLRNAPAHVTALLGVLLAGATVVAVNPGRGRDRTRTELAELALPLVLGLPGDLSELVPAGMATASPAGLFTGPAPDLVDTEPLGCPVAVRMLTSGTTGPPKRIDLSYDALAHSVIGPAFRTAPAVETPRTGVAVVHSPLVHIAGVYRVLQCVTQARPFVLLPRFDLPSWARAVRRYRPRAVSLVPAALRTVLHSDLTQDDLASVQVITSGTAPLAAADADAFEAKFGIPVLTSYAATEFAGGVAGWTLAEHREYWSSKRGSVGRAQGGSRLRVVADDGTELPPNTTGLLEVVPGQLGPGADWIRTTDLARLDPDGFLWIVGRADQAIIRGGFKIIPDDVQCALESHPAVRGAAVVARPDERLGATPVALVELRAAADPMELTGYLRDRLAGYEVPTEIVVVSTLPRTPSGKADLSAVRRYFVESTGDRTDRAG